MKLVSVKDLTDSNILGFYASKEVAHSMYTILMILSQYVKLFLLE